MVIYQYESERYIVMEKMQEDVFDKIKPTEHSKKCQHEFVKLYHLGINDVCKVANKYINKNISLRL